ncbi:nuclear transport factor 2 family protein [Mycobacterium sp. NBC_00419]|uniref:nuclear transport factor 2 family protein n=1 Tax=Mycobacterium sp. NBC_00419 TaxID=2975989 RepID=UPI002E1E8ABC
MSPTRTEILDVADRLFAAIETGDIPTLTALWSDDVVVWRQGGGRERDKPRALGVIEWFVGATTARRYEVLDREAFDNGFVQQHILHATTRGGESVALRVCLVVKLNEHGLIRRIDEYLDPADLNPLLQ